MLSLICFPSKILSLSFDVILGMDLKYFLWNSKELLAENVVSKVKEEYNSVAHFSKSL